MNGGTRVVAIYAAELLRRGHNVTVVAPPPKPVSLVRRLKTSIVAHRSSPRAKIQQTHFDASPVTCTVLERWRPVEEGDVPDADIVVATWWETAEWVNRFSRNKGEKVYFIQHHEIFPYLPVDRCHATYILPFQKIVVARWLQDVMRKRYGDENAVLVPNSVDKHQFFAPPRSKQNPPTLGFLYSVSEFKGVPDTLATIEKLRSRIPSLKVVALGVHPPTKTMPLPSDTEFFQSPHQDQLRHVYSKCDVWLTTSLSEGFNLCAMEAMACRTPVVSTRTGWPEEAIVDGWNGWLCEVGDVNGLVQGVESVILKQPEDWRRLSDNAFKTVAQSSWERSADLFEIALEQALLRPTEQTTEPHC